MIKIKLTTSSPEWPLKRQTPNSTGIWRNCQFFINQNIKKCDYWVVFGGLKKKQTTHCYPNNTILVTTEPPSIKKYSKQFVQQFNTVITVQKDIKVQNIINLQLLPWYIGTHHNVNQNRFNTYTKSYDELKQISHTSKTRLISIISSNKTSTKGHRQRLKFIQILKTHFGDNLDVFGAGINQITDKWDGIAPYKYHIVIENSEQKNYWTEKLADTFLAKTYPFYYGCPNIDDYFPQKTLTKIDINKPEEAIEIIEEAIRENYYEQFKNNIFESKNLILDKYQIFPQLCQIINNSKISKKEKVLITIAPEVAKKKNILLRIIYKLLKNIHDRQ